MRAPFFSLVLVAFPFVAAGCVVTTPPPTDPGPGPTPPGMEPPTDPQPTSAPADPKPPADPTPPVDTADPTPPADPPSAGQTCGSRGLAPCPSDQFCDFPAGSECGATDRGGACKPIPQICTRDYRPVCGCDGQTYPNACAANTKGVSVSKQGKCG